MAGWTLGHAKAELWSQDLSCALIVFMTPRDARIVTAGTLVTVAWLLGYRKYWLPRKDEPRLQIGDDEFCGYSSIKHIEKRDAVVSVRQKWLYNANGPCMCEAWASGVHQFMTT